MENDENAGLYLNRITKVSRGLIKLCLLQMIYCCVMVVLMLSLPIVEVTPLYSDPSALRTRGSSENQVSEKEPGWPSDNFRLVLNLTERSPSILRFSYEPGPSTIRQGDEWIARVCAVPFPLYYLFGGFLFFRLFRSFEEMKIFKLETVCMLRWIGCWLIGLNVMNQLYEFSSYLWSLDPSASIAFESTLFFGLFILVVAWILEEASHLAKEQSLTV